MPISQRLVLSGLLSAGFLVAPAFAQQQYGDIKGKFVYGEDAPVLAPLIAKGKAPKDPTICAVNQAIPDQSLVIDPKTKGIANVFIYLKAAPALIHPDLVKPPAEPAEFGQENCTFEPHAMFVRAGQGVAVGSNDAAAHNTHTFPIKNTAVNFLLPPKPPVPIVVATPQSEILPIQVKCDIHPWMTAYWLILDHPYAAVSKADGTFEIKNLPVGDYEFRVWHEKAGYLDRGLEVTVKPNVATDVAETYEAKDFD